MLTTDRLYASGQAPRVGLLEGCFDGVRVGGLEGAIEGFFVGETEGNDEGMPDGKLVLSTSVG